MRAFMLTVYCLLIQTVAAGNRQSQLTSIPFEMVGTYVVVTVHINTSTPLRFILDSGLGNTMITEIGAADSLSLRYSDKVRIKGLGAGRTVEALVSHDNTLQVGRMRFVNQTVHLLAEDVFNLSALTGRPINGLLGSDFFQDHVVQIDYIKRRITFFESSSFEVPRGFVAVPLIIRQQKMYTELLVRQEQGKPRQAMVLLDTGAELTAWLHLQGNNPLMLPSKTLYGYIGEGLNGPITGHFGRIPGLFVGGWKLDKPVVSFPDSSSIADMLRDETREGTLGSQALSRFHLIFDEPNGLMYLKPNHLHRKPFTYNVSGMDMIKQAEAPFLPLIYHVREGSPAHKAGIQSGDLLLTAKGMSGFSTDINVLRGLMEKPSRTPIMLTLLRNGTAIEANLLLKDVLAD